jgi:hypothetical protein
MDNPEKLATQDEEKQYVFDTTFTRSSNAYDQIIYVCWTECFDVELSGKKRQWGKM